MAAFANLIIGEVDRKAEEARHAMPRLNESPHELTPEDACKQMIKGLAALLALGLKAEARKDAERAGNGHKSACKTPKSSTADKTR